MQSKEDDSSAPALVEITVEWNTKFVKKFQIDPLDFVSTIVSLICHEFSILDGEHSYELSNEVSSFTLVYKQPGSNGDSIIYLIDEKFSDQIASLNGTKTLSFTLMKKPEKVVQVYIQLLKYGFIESDEVVDMQEEKKKKIFHLKNLLLQDSTFADEFIQQQGVSLLIDFIHQEPPGNTQAYALQALKHCFTYVTALKLLESQPDTKLIEKIYQIIDHPNMILAPATPAVYRSALDILIILCNYMQPRTSIEEEQEKVPLSSVQMIHQVAKRVAKAKKQSQEKNEESLGKLLLQRKYTAKVFTGGVKETPTPYLNLYYLLGKDDITLKLNVLLFCNVMLSKCREGDYLKKKLVYRWNEVGVVKLLKGMSHIENKELQDQISLFQKLSQISIPKSWLMCHQLQTEKQVLELLVREFRRQQPYVHLLQTEIQRLHRELREALWSADHPLFATTSLQSHSERRLKDEQEKEPNPTEFSDVSEFVKENLKCTDQVKQALLKQEEESDADFFLPAPASNIKLAKPKKEDFPQPTPPPPQQLTSPRENSIISPRQQKDDTKPTVQRQASVFIPSIDVLKNTKLRKVTVMDTSKFQAQAEEEKKDQNKEQIDELQQTIKELQQKIKDLQTQNQEQENIINQFKEANPTSRIGNTREVEIQTVLTGNVEPVVSRMVALQNKLASLLGGGKNISTSTATAVDTSTSPSVAEPKETNEIAIQTEWEDESNLQLDNSSTEIQVGSDAKEPKLDTVQEETKNDLKEDEVMKEPVIVTVEDDLQSKEQQVTPIEVSHPLPQEQASTDSSDIIVSTAPGAPLPPPPPMMKPKQRVTEKPQITPSVKMKPLHWQRIILYEQDASVVWNSIAKDYGSISLDNQSIASLFKQSAPTSTTSAATIAQEKNKQIGFTGLLDHKLVQRWSIGLYKLGDLDFIKQGVLNYSLSKEQVECLMQILPSETVLEMYHQYKSSSTVNTADWIEKYLEMVLSIPNFHKRISCWNLFLEVEQLWRESVEMPLEVVTQSLKEVLTSPILIQLLAYTLYLGNYLNGGNKNLEQADGFILHQTLHKLQQIKDVNNRMNALEFILDILRRKRKSTIPLQQLMEKELANLITNTKQKYSSVMEQSVEQLMSKWKLLEMGMTLLLQETSDVQDGIASTWMTNKLNLCHEWMKRLEQNYSACIDLYQKVCHYFGYTQLATQISMDELLMSCGQFVEQSIQILNKWDEKLEQQKHAGKRMFMKQMDTPQQDLMESMVKDLQETLLKRNEIR